MRLVFVTTNRHKFEEASDVAAGYGIKLKHRDMEYPELQVDCLEEVVRCGIKHACARLGSPCFAEDAGMVVKALNGFPGPYSSYVFRTIGNAGMLRLMRGVRDRGAEFRSAIGYCEPGKAPRIFTGRVKGRITRSARGRKGFGFDPIFEPVEGDGRTFAEMSIGEKNTLSHRARSTKAFLNWYRQRRKAGA